MSNLVTRTLTVNASHSDQAAALCACLPSGAGMFTRAYGTVDPETGEQTIIGYISSGLIADEFAQLLPVKLYDGDTYQQQPADIPAILQIATDAGLQVTEQEILDVFAAADISNQPAHGVMARLGMVLL